MGLTTKGIAALKQGEWASDGGARGAGALVFRRSASGEILAYFRYTLPNGKRDTLAIGTYDEKGQSGLALTEARDKAGELSRLYQSGVRDLRAHFAAEKQAKEEQNAATQAQIAQEEQEAIARQQYTLKNLCEDYCRYLESRGKGQSAKQARSTFKVHINEAAPDIAALPAREVTSHQVAALVRKVTEKGKSRMAGVLRSYLSAAYNAARKAPFDTALPSKLIAYGVENNPVEIIATIAVNRGLRTLSESELKSYLSKLGDELSQKALRVALYAGGQRMAQLLRCRIADYDPRTKILRLWDGKGKRKSPREHLVPLGPVGAALIEELIGRARQLEQSWAEREKREPRDGTLWIFSSYGTKPMTDTTPGKYVSEVWQEMGCEPFDLRDIRRTVETILASLKVSKDVRAQLLSHGLSGVQDAHYDRFEYIDEKRKALTAWEKHLKKITA